MKNKTIKKGLFTLGRIAQTGCKVVCFGVLTALSYLSATDVVKVVRYSGVVGYGDAVSAIMESSMWSEDKKKAVAVLKQNQHSDFYKAIIHVAQSSMWSEDKVKTIMDMCEN